MSRASTAAIAGGLLLIGVGVGGAIGDAGATAKASPPYPGPPTTTIPDEGVGEASFCRLEGKPVPYLSSSQGAWLFVVSCPSSSAGREYTIIILDEDAATAVVDALRGGDEITTSEED